ncbi:MAG: hypothetical protein JW749_07410 [Sedimentisphaerales bacterium]|nr:hypothetical protein [Sedimentisphaerales bacterium]
MSNLTKVFIVLLTITSIFLCAIVVTYVANADNYKTRYSRIISERDALEQSKESLTSQLNEKNQQKDDLEKSLTGRIASEKAKADELRGKLGELERQNADLVQRTNDFAAVTKAFSETADKQTQTLNAALEEVKQLKAEQIKMGRELEEKSQALMEKTAIIETLETDKRRLTEEKADIQTRLDRLLGAGRGVAAAGLPVTPERGPAIAIPPVDRQVPLKGLVSEVDVRNAMATVSIGSADGVMKGTKFHITRGDEYICELSITDVDTDRAVGVLDLIQQQPRAGDNAVTEL